MIARPLAITGLGVICAAGQGSDALAELVRAGRSALDRRSRVPSALVDPGWTGSVPEGLDVEFDELPGGEVQRCFVDWAIVAGREALARSRVLERVASDRMALVIGSNLEDYPLPLWQLADEVARTLAITGPRTIVSMACASSIAAMSVARMLLERGEVEAALVGGVDVLTPRVAGGFRSLDLLGDRPCAPFSSQVGTALGEGAGLLVLEAREPGEAEGAIAWLLGEGSAADAFHETSPEPRGRGTELALTRALAQAGLAARDVDMILAHGTGTEANDAAEARALRRVFGPELERIAVGAGKSLVGHAQGAAGAIELIAGLLGVGERVAPRIANFVAPARAEAPPNLLIDEAACRIAVDRFVVEGAGFGGAHAALVVGRTPARTHAPALVRRRPTLCTWTSLIADADRRVELDWRKVVRGVDLRASDPSTRMLSAVVDAALRGAGVSRRRAEVGLFVAQRGSSTAAIGRLRGELEQWGMAGTAASAFTDSLAIVPAGACARALELWGPMQLICGDALAGALALLGAADALGRDSSLRCMIAAGVDERDPARPDSRDGAWAIALGEGGAWTLLGSAITGPGGDPLAIAKTRAKVASIDRVVRVERLDEFAVALDDEAGPLALVAAGLGGCAALILAR
ncbi:beta-ketoacyl synthase N-terminal-like domain-containing protein [Nannocystaceae bacterium ST9]